MRPSIRNSGGALVDPKAVSSHQYRDLTAIVVIRHALQFPRISGSDVSQASVKTVESPGYWGNIQDLLLHSRKSSKLKETTERSSAMSPKKPQPKKPVKEGNVILEFNGNKFSDSRHRTRMARLNRVHCAAQILPMARPRAGGRSPRKSRPERFPEQQQLRQRQDDNHANG